MGLELLRDTEDRPRPAPEPLEGTVRIFHRILDIRRAPRRDERVDQPEERKRYIVEARGVEVALRGDAARKPRVAQSVVAAPGSRASGPIELIARGSIGSSGASCSGVGRIAR
ncbi:MAG: hypothetical protein KF773_17470 [Deltaproteobacteria bacterium]|nr:hypothetical protein [Deltaproteobacteria bacterium]